MVSQLTERLPRNRHLRNIALAYGLVFNIGLLALYNEFASPHAAFDETLRWGIGSSAMGLTACFFFFAANRTPNEKP